MALAAQIHLRIVGLFERVPACDRRNGVGIRRGERAQKLVPCRCVPVGIMARHADGPFLGGGVRTRRCVGMGGGEVGLHSTGMAGTAAQHIGRACDRIIHHPHDLWFDLPVRGGLPFVVGPVGQIVMAPAAKHCSALQNRPPVAVRPVPDSSRTVAAFALNPFKSLVANSVASGPSVAHGMARQTAGVRCIRPVPFLQGLERLCVGCLQPEIIICVRRGCPPALDGMALAAGKRSASGQPVNRGHARDLEQGLVPHPGQFHGENVVGERRTDIDPVATSQIGAVGHLERPALIATGRHLQRSFGVCAGENDWPWIDATRNHLQHAGGIGRR